VGCLDQRSPEAELLKEHLRAVEQAHEDAASLLSSSAMQRCQARAAADVRAPAQAPNASRWRASIARAASVPTLIPRPRRSLARRAAPHWPSHGGARYYNESGPFSNHDYQRQ
jgi:hypothetical protein